MIDYMKLIFERGCERFFEGCGFLFGEGFSSKEATRLFAGGVLCELFFSGDAFVLLWRDDGAGRLVDVDELALPLLPFVVPLARELDVPDWNLPVFLFREIPIRAIGSD